ncbi:MAG TPA: hypothetical protein VHO71_02115 [Caproiciproducens sp.]|nr:hypothetical protein [Caproiciproducens sp.]
MARLRGRLHINGEPGRCGFRGKGSKKGLQQIVHLPQSRFTKYLDQE